MAKEFLNDKEIAETGLANFPVIWQKESLGIDRKAIAHLVGKRVLDIGCGDGRLVHALRQSRILAEGIDSSFKPNEYILQQFVNASSPIPRPDNCYDLVFASAITSIEYTFSSFRKFFQVNDAAHNYIRNAGETKADAEAIISEALRVLKSGGRFIAYPSLNQIGDFRQRVESSGVKIRTERVRREHFKDEAKEGILGLILVGLPDGDVREISQLEDLEQYF